jgi:hypothetical protein
MFVENPGYKTKQTDHATLLPCSLNRKSDLLTKNREL